MVRKSILDNKNISDIFLSESNWLIFTTLLRTDRIHDNIREVKLTQASRQRYKIWLPIEGLKNTTKTITN